MEEKEIKTEMVYDVVTVKHPNCPTPYTFKVPGYMKLHVGEYVLCDTKNHNMPQVAVCITPDFMISGLHLRELYNINPESMRCVVARLQPVPNLNNSSDGEEK